MLPILLLLGTMVSDAGKQIATARAELAGLVTVQSLTTLFAVFDRASPDALSSSTPAA